MPASAQDLEGEFQRARTLDLVIGDTAGAISIYEEIASAGSGSSSEALALLELAKKYREIGQNAQARAALERVVREYERYSEVSDRALLQLSQLTTVSVSLPLSEDPFSFALSPDGSRIVYTVSFGGSGQLWLHDLRTNQALPVAGARIAHSSYFIKPVPTALPFWSPDGESIGYFSSGKLKVVSADGGAPRVLADAFDPKGGTWSSDGTIVFAFGGEIFSDGNIRAIRADGSSGPETINVPNGACPVFLPDGRHFLVSRSDAMYGIRLGPGVWIGSIDDAELVHMPIEAAYATFVEPDRLLYVSRDNLFVQRIDLETFELLGEPQQLEGNFFGDARRVCVRGVSASLSGAIAHRSTLQPFEQRQLIRVNRRGETMMTLPIDLRMPTQARVSVDGSRVLFGRQRGGNLTIVVSELETKSEREVLRGTVNSIWGPMPGTITINAFWPQSSFESHLINVSLDDSSWLPILPETGARPVDWSQDGNLILYRSFGDSDLRALTSDAFVDLERSLRGASTAVPQRTPIAVATTNANEEQGRFSPDGSWVSFQSDEIDGVYEVFAQPLQDQGARVRISSGGGHFPVWKGDEIFYISDGSELMSARVHVSADGNVEFGEPVALFEVPLGSQFDVFPDGESFLLNAEIDPDPLAPVIVSTDWVSEL